nr:hypothetical protein [Tanacetum cinerariifolium]
VASDDLRGALFVIYLISAHLRSIGIDIPVRVISYHWGKRTYTMSKVGCCGLEHHQGQGIGKTQGSNRLEDVRHKGNKFVILHTHDLDGVKLQTDHSTPTTFKSKVQDVIKNEIVRRMPFGLCNAPTTFRRCMTAIFHDIVEEFMEVFMDYFSVFSNSFDQCLDNLDKMLARCEETNFVLNWEKCHFTVKEDKKEAKNLAADHLSRLKNPNMGELTEEEIADEFPDEHLMILKARFNDDEPWYADYVNYILGKLVPQKWKSKRRKQFFSQVRNYFWDEPYVFRLCPDNVMRRCVTRDEILEILAHWHSGPTRGHYSASVTGRKVYESRLYWPIIFKDAKDYATKSGYKTPTTCTPFSLVYGKARHLTVEIEHKAYLALKQCNMDLTAAAKNHFMEINELMELRDGAYGNTQIYKERTNKWHDSRLLWDKYFKIGEKVLLFNSRLRMQYGVSLGLDMAYSPCTDLTVKKSTN